MKRLACSVALLFVAIGLNTDLISQQPQTPLIQQTATHLDAAVNVASNGTSNTTTTITPPGGQFVYITGMDIENCAGSSSTTLAAQTAITTTNLAGVQWQIPVGPTAGLCTSEPTNIGPTGLKSATSGTAVTFVVPAFGTNQTLRLNVYYYFGL